MYRYVEIVDNESELTVKRYDVTLMSEDGVETVVLGCEETIDPYKNFVRKIECQTRLETGLL